MRPLNVCPSALTINTDRLRVNNAMDVLAVDADLSIGQNYWEQNKDPIKSINKLILWNVFLNDSLRAGYYAHDWHAEWGKISTNSTLIAVDWLWLSCNDNSVPLA